MILASLRISRRCVEMMYFNGSMNGGIYCSISTFNRICLVNMCNYLAAYTPLYLVACSNMRALLHAYLEGMEALDLILSEPPPTCTAFLYVRSDTPMDPMCVREANALVRLCICLGSSELSMSA